MLLLAPLSRFRFNWTIGGILLQIVGTLFYVVMVYTFVPFFEYGSPEEIEARRQPRDLRQFPGVWRTASQGENAEPNEDGEKSPRDSEGEDGDFTSGI